MTAQEKAKAIKDAKYGINRAKTELHSVVRKLESLSPAQAEQLAKMIARLEYFQNK